MTGSYFSDRRKNKRYRVGRGVLVAPSRDEHKWWHVLDLGRGGLAFRYVPEDGELKTSSELDIVTDDTRFLLEQIPFRSISDREMTDRPASGRKVRRRGVQFGRLADAQVKQLEYLIRNRTVGEA